MVTFVDDGKPVQLVAESNITTTLTIYDSASTVKDLTTYTTVKFQYFINLSNNQYSLPITILTPKTNGQVRISPANTSLYPKIEGVQTRLRGTAKVIFDDGLTTEFSTPPFPIEVLRNQ